MLFVEDAFQFSYYNPHGSYFWMKYKDAGRSWQCTCHYHDPVPSASGTGTKVFCTRTLTVPVGDMFATTTLDALKAWADLANDKPDKKKHQLASVGEGSRPPAKRPRTSSSAAAASAPGPPSPGLAPAAAADAPGPAAGGPAGDRQSSSSSSGSSSSSSS